MMFEEELLWWNEIYNGLEIPQVHSQFIHKCFTVRELESATANILIKHESLNNWFSYAWVLQLLTFI